MRKHLSSLLLGLLVWLPTDAVLAQAFKINAGGAAVAPFAADNSFAGGSNAYVTTAAITGNGSYPMAIYQTERSGNFTYTLTGFPANSPCEVRLHFAETFWTVTGKRIFNVEINGTTVLSNYDIVAKVGNKNIATTETFLANSNASGQLLINFISGIDNAKVSAIEAKALFAGNYTTKTKLQSGKGAAGAVGPYLNGKLPSLNPTQTSASGGWDVVNAFPGLAGQFPNIMSLYAVPNTTPQKLIARLRGGQMKVFDENAAATLAETFMDIGDRVSTNHNGGLSAFCFHPEFNVPGSPNKDYVYVYYQTIQSGVMYNRLSRFTRNPTTGKINNTTELIMIQTIDVVIFDHTGGSMIFDNQGYLILMYGDLEWTDEEYAHCMTLDTMFQSSIIRIDVDMKPTNLKATRTLQGGLVNGIQTTKSLNSGRYAGAGNFSGIGYHIPADNPYNDIPTALKEHYGKGVRNPWNISKDPVTGDILFFDAGSNVGDKWEEVNLLKAKADYGWPYWEGPISKTFETGIAAPVPVMHNSPTPIITPLGTFTQDVASYNHTDGNGNAMGDGDVYQGNSLPGLKGKLIFCDFTSGRIWAKDYKTPGSANTVLMDGDGGIAGIKSSPDKETLYIINYNNGIIYKMVSVGVPNPQPPALLSQTGAFTELATLTPAPGLIPYEPASPLWSDNSAKHRWMAIPNDGTHNTAAEKVTFSANSEWQFPVGSVFVKHFELPNNVNSPNNVVRLETRFLVHGADGYFAFSYKWNDEGTEAFLQNNGSTATIPVTKAGGVVSNQVWQFPSQSSCMDCHQLAAGRVLGANTHSLNWQFPYVTPGTQNQLTYLNSKSIFNQTLDPAQIASYLAAKSLTDTSASVETRVRSFLDMNCASCHRPGGVAGRAVFDARLTTPLSLAGLINASPSADTLGLTNPKLIKPGDAANSLISVRDTSRNPSIQMPPLGTTIPHPEYISLLNTWINSMSGSGDSDGDGVPDAQDAFPNDPTEWADTDGDGVGNNSDVFPSDPTEWADANGDGIGDNTVLGQLQPIVALNAGGAAAGTFSADANFTGGNTFTSITPISGKPAGIPDAVYQTERSGNFSYTISGLAPQSYHRVELHFAEIYWTAPGLRLFDVILNGNVVLNDFDVFTAAGGGNTALVKEFVIKPDATGKIIVQFTTVLDQAKLSGLTIGQYLGSTTADNDGDGYPNATDAFPNDPLEWADANGDGVGDNTVLGALEPVVAINAGGATAGNFLADTNFTGGGTFSSTAAITGAPSGIPSAIYQTERNTDFTYTFSGLAPASYHRVELHFAELFWTLPGKRVFDVSINGKPTLNSFDIFAAAGGINKAIVKAFVVKPDAAGNITIQFTTILDQAKVSGISIAKHLGSGAPDSDGDGVPDAQDAFPNNPLETKDTDGDSFGDNSDAFPTDPTEWADTNGDGVGDNTILGALEPILALNAGGPATVPFLADTYFTGGGTFATTAPITGVPVGIPAEIYQTERNTDFTYTFTDLDPAAYHRIELHFAEIYWTEPGKRLFDVTLNGKLILDNFDVFAAAGGINKALVKAFVAKPNASGTITLQFTTVIDQAKLSGINLAKHTSVIVVDTDGDGVPDAQDAFPNDPTETADTDGDGVGDNADKFPTDPTETKDTDLDGVGDNSDAFPTDPLETKDTDGDGIGDNTVLGPKLKVREINSGGAATGTFAADSSFTGGTVVTNTATVTGAPAGVPAAIYKSERNGTFTYTFSGLTPASFHRVEMHFAETLWTASAQRKFDVMVNGKLVLDDVDIFAVAGGANKAYVKPVGLKPDATGNITIQFTGVLDKAMVNGITLHKHLAVTATDSDGDGVANSLDTFPADPTEWKDSNGDGAGDNTILGTPQIIKSINSGGAGAGTFVADANFTGGTAASNTATVTGVPTGVSATIYKSERNGNFTYTFTGLMPSAYHKVDLHFAETTTTNTAGKRKFNVTANGAVVLNGFDIFVAAAGANKATAKTFVFKSNATGTITLQFNGVVGVAKVNGLSVFKQIAVTVFDSDGDGVADAQDPFPSNPFEWKDSDGDGYGDNYDAFPADPLEWVDANGDGVGDNTVLGALQLIKSINSGGAAAGTFVADANFTGGTTLTRTRTVTGVPTGVPAGIFNTERNGAFTYTFTALDTTAYHRIQLYFVETGFTTSAKRKFDVTFNGKLVLDDFDIFVAAGGASKATSKVYVLKPDATGKITIQFTSVVSVAKVNGLSISKHLPVASAVSASLKSAASVSGAAPVDSDGDGIIDSLDAFPNNALESSDTDRDGAGDNSDLFPADASTNGKGNYTILLPVPTSVTAIGDGYGLLTLDKTLKGQLTLNMGDGSQFIQAVSVVNRKLTIDAKGTAPHTGDTLRGTLTWNPQAGVSDFNGPLTWTIAGQTTPISIVAMGSLYTPATLQAQFGKANVMVDLMGNPTDILNAATVSGNSVTWTLSPTTGTFNQATGLLTWNVTTATGKTLTIEGVYFDDQNIVGGFFHDGINEVGIVEIAPQ